VTSAGEPVRLSPNRSSLEGILEPCKEGMLVAPWVVAQDECGTISRAEDPWYSAKSGRDRPLGRPYPRRAVLREANLGDVETLTQEQIEEAIGAATTKLR
jgi:hypothetical protein